MTERNAQYGVESFDGAKSDIYRAEGFAVYTRAFADGVAARALDALQGLFDRCPEGAGAVVTAYGEAGVDSGQTRIDHPHLVSEDVRALATHPDLACAIGKTLGVGAAQLWYCHALRKPAGVDRNTHVGWHFDGQYSPFFAGDFVTAWIPLTDNGPAGAPLVYVRKTHKVRIPVQSGFSHKISLDELKHSIVDAAGIDWNETHVAAAPHRFVLHSSRILHGSAANHSAAPRISLTCHFRTEANRLTGRRYSKFNPEELEDMKKCPLLFGDKKLLDFAG